MCIVTMSLYNLSGWLQGPKNQTPRYKIIYPEQSELCAVAHEFRVNEKQQTGPLEIF